MRLSEHGLNQIRKHEGFGPDIYRDVAGLKTVGYGHLLTASDKAIGRFKYGVSEEGAMRLLAEDVAWAERVVNNLVRVSLKQQEFDALTSFVFNIGATAFRRSTALKRLNRGDKRGAAEAMTWWNKITVKGKKVPSQGLSNRRMAEYQLFRGDKDGA